MYQFKKIESCQHHLDFHPDNPWSELLPRYCHDDELLCGFQRPAHENELVIDLKNQNLSLCLKTIYPSLSFPELSRLIAQLLARYPQLLDLSNEMWSLYGYQPRENLTLLAQKVIDLPLDIQRWFSQKKFAPQDLAPLRAINDLSVLSDYWDDLLLANPSKSEGAKWLEMLIELILMGLPKELLKLSCHWPLDTNNSRIHPDSTTQWLAHLHRLRYPLATQQTKRVEQKIHSFAWPPKSEARWTRRGDRSGVELKLFFSNPQELKVNTLRLEKIAQTLENNNQWDELWSKN